ncbi:alpha-(1,3)-fucosyltransferase C-like [Cydia fagiglandana]|uniref:alpha-(1,3)-fucosyltransferase C-like n=1 Tax=Cydia fagiglandana TaxID=1458189 RepID=UPI002FEE153E
MRPLAKLFFLTSFLFVTLFLYMSLREIKNTQLLFETKNIFNIEKNLTRFNFVDKLIKSDKSDKKIKYILQWTNPNNVPFVYMLEGNKVFIERKCEYTNCYVTSNKSLLGDVSKFDVIAFSGTEVVYWPIENLIPPKRSPHQKYVFTNIESADNYPFCSNKLDNFFNWTWTFRLDSETKWGYIIVRDANNNIIGPKKEMHWMKLQDMDPVSEKLSAEFRKKSKAAAWFVSNCWTRSRRENFASDLQKALKPYDLEVDIYGKCGPYKCERDDEEACFQIIKRDYYFYLSFENSLSEDYVTEKLLSALKYNAIPIVYGGANYTRFMPDGIYLNARELGAEKLAKKMKYLIDHPDEYKEYFRWKNHYSYSRRNDYAETDDYCGFCTLLNNEEMVKKKSVYKNFKEWWNDPHRC